MTSARPCFGLFRAARRTAETSGLTASESGQAWLDGGDRWFRGAIGTPGSTFPATHAAGAETGHALLIRQVEDRSVLCLQTMDTVATATRNRLERSWACAAQDRRLLWRDGLRLYRCLHELAARAGDETAFALAEPTDDPALRVRGLGLALGALDAGLLVSEPRFSGITAVAEAADFETLAVAAIALHLASDGQPVAVLSQATSQERQEFIEAGWLITLAPEQHTEVLGARPLPEHVGTLRGAPWLELEARLLDDAGVRDATIGANLATGLAARSRTEPDVADLLDLPSEWLPFAVLNDAERLLQLAWWAREPAAAAFERALESIDPEAPEHLQMAVELCWLADQWRAAGHETALENCEGTLLTLRRAMTSGTPAARS